MVKVSSRVIQMSQYLQNFLSLGLEAKASEGKEQDVGEEEADIEVDLPLGTFRHFLEFC